jgi:predicted nucleic acid-binding Zn ribbon protein
MTRWKRGRQVPHLPGESTDPMAVGEALAEVGAELGLADPLVVGVLAERWPDIVGTNIAGNARLRALRGATLTIAVDSGAWATQLRYLESDVLARIAAIVGDGVVEQVRVVVTPRDVGHDDERADRHEDKG